MSKGEALKELAGEMECLSLELTNLEAQVSKIRAEIAQLSLEPEPSLT